MWIRVAFQALLWSVILVPALGAGICLNGWLDRTGRGAQRFGRADVSLIVVAWLWCLVRVAFIAGPTTELQFLSLFTFVGFGVATTTALIRAVVWTLKRRWTAWITFLACISAHLVSGPIGAAVQEALFTRALPRYEAVVHRLETDPNWEPPFEEGRVFVWPTDGVLCVEFNYGSGFPVKHSAYLYTSSGTIPPGSRVDKRWPYKDRIRDKWFRVEN